MNNLDAIYVDIDHFSLRFKLPWLAHLIEAGEKQRIKPSWLTSSEVMTILIAQQEILHNNVIQQPQTSFISWLSKSK